MASQFDFRKHLERLEQTGLLRHVTTEVDKNWEISAVMRWVYHGNPENKRYAVMFDNVKGYTTPVVVGVIGASYLTYAVSLGIDPTQSKSEVLRQIRARWKKAIDDPIPPVMVSEGSCQEVVMAGSDVNMHKLPVPVWTPEKDRYWKEGYGFLTSPYHITKDPETGIRNVGTYRNMLRRERDEMGIFPSPGTDLFGHVNKNEAKGLPTEIATVIGAQPAVGLTSVTGFPPDYDEMAIAGGLCREAIEMVKCKTVNLEVPATAEFVIEGRILPPQDRPYEIEGPFGEFTGHQGGSLLNPIYKITCITHRKNPIYQGFISEMPPSESSKVRHLSTEALVLRQLDLLGVEGIVDINMPETAQSHISIVSIKKISVGHPAKVANALFSILQPGAGKIVIVVDDDVDVWDYDHVWWALTFRNSMVPSRMNTRLIEGLQAVKLDYSAIMEFSNERKPPIMGLPATGLFIDATRPFIPYPGVSLPPAHYLLNARDQWETYNLPALERTDLPKPSVLEEEHLKKGFVVFPAVDIV
ncbi:MAG TPA: UbiD family decarboxylase [Thermodesulfobacteriota bacterium]|nr:UbiD family decarboxylase [Thermodesulfobacteriota bacterium]